MVMSVAAGHSNPPAILGGNPAFAERLDLVHPSIPATAVLQADFDRILSSGQLTNGSFVRRFEEASARYLGVEHCVAVSSCTAGLMLILRASGISGDVIIPSFTFSATGHAVVWNGLRPTFADVEPTTLTLDPDSVKHVIGVRTSAIMATHLYGTPCDVEGLRALARDNGLRLFFDAAHAFGSSHRGTMAGGLGDAEVFSLSPTKVLIAGEGGMIATNDDLLAERCRIGRDYGNPGDYDCRFIGLNARMSEFHAAIGLRSLQTLDERIDRRNELAALYKSALAAVPGIDFPTIPEGDRSTYKDFTILLDAEEFGMPVTALADALGAEGIDTRRYYYPPLHLMDAYQGIASSSASLDVTEKVMNQVLTLPLWTDLTDEEVRRVAETVAVIQSRSTEISHDLKEVG